MSDLNVKTLTIDVDRAALITQAEDVTIQSLYFYRGNEYILQANCYSNSYSSVLQGFGNAATDSWAVYIGRVYENNAAPVCVITNPALFNNTTDWSSANVLAGLISARVNVSGTALDTDLANLSSQTYNFELVLTNNVGGEVMVCDANCYVKNAVQK
jgi:hypothetical protein